MEWMVVDVLVVGDAHALGLVPAFGWIDGA
jgi:hypothetical protein